jgi:hypothetical protein
MPLRRMMTGGIGAFGGGRKQASSDSTQRHRGTEKKGKGEGRKMTEPLRGSPYLGHQ